MSDRPNGGIDRSSISMAEFNDLLTFEPDHAKPTTHALIIRDDNDLLIYGKRSKNKNSEWELRRFQVIGEDVQFSASDLDRASVAAILVENFDGDALTTDERHVNRRPVRYGVPVAVAVDGKPAVAAWLYARGEERDRIAQLMDVGERTVSEYLSRFRQCGVGIPDGLDAPEPGEIVPDVPLAFDPARQRIVADGGKQHGDGIDRSASDAERSTHVDKDGLRVPSELREFTAQVVFRTPRATIQHFGNSPLDPYYGLIDESHFGDVDEFDNPKNPDLAPDRIFIKPQGEDACVFEVSVDV